MPWRVWSRSDYFSDLGLRLSFLKFCVSWSILLQGFYCYVGRNYQEKALCLRLLVCYPYRAFWQKNSVFWLHSVSFSLCLQIFQNWNNYMLLKINSSNIRLFFLARQKLAWGLRSWCSSQLFIFPRDIRLQCDKIWLHRLVCINLRYYRPSTVQGPSETLFQRNHSSGRTLKYFSKSIYMKHRKIGASIKSWKATITLVCFFLYFGGTFDTLLSLFWTWNTQMYCSLLFNFFLHLSWWHEFAQCLKFSSVPTGII